MIEGLQPTLEGLAHWRIRPERTVSLLESLDRFLASGPSKNQGCNRFGHLTLPSLEKLAEAWAQELDPYWIEARKDVSQRREKKREIPDYLGIDTIYGEEIEATVARIARESVIAAARAVAKEGDIDGILPSCRNLRTLDVIKPVEEELGLPIFGSNLALTWAMARAAGPQVVPQGAFRLLQTIPA